VSELHFDSLTTASGSYLDHVSIDDIYSEIREVYLSDDRPWVIGYSGGKDSTTALQLAWHAIAGLAPEERQKPVYVIASDTLVETPVIVGHITSTLDRINRAAREKSMPFIAQTVVPQIQDTFWVNLIGRGYPAPNTKFRWCTDRLKIQPANRFILDRVAEHGEVVLLLGVRRGESITRDQVMSLRRISGSRMSTHSTLSNAYVYTPIEYFTVDDVWTYLLNVPSPWGNDNNQLLTLYQNANSGECPLVIDKTTPSCGNSRFGCWSCTVVTKDKSMEALIDSGEEWMEPLLEFRDHLAATQDPEIKPLIREYRRRNGQVTRNSSRRDRHVPGPYTLDFCEDLLRKLLDAQLKCRQLSGDDNFEAISRDELLEIRRIWRLERQDWSDRVPKVYESVMGEPFPVPNEDEASFSEEEETLLEDLCEAANVPPQLLKNLLDTERDFQGMKRRAGIFERIDQIFNQEWRSLDEILASWEAERDMEQE
jgi:DNA sulfur modification protein DndC